MGIENNFLSLFQKSTPIIAKLHLRGDIEQTKHDIDTMLSNGIDGLLVSSDYGKMIDISKMLNYLHKQENIIYGIRIYNESDSSFELAKRYNASYIYFDSLYDNIFGNDEILKTKINKLIKNINIPVIGGTKFSAFEFLNKKENCSSGIVLLDNNYKGDLKLLQEIKNKINKTIIIGDGLTQKNIVDKLLIADCGIVDECLNEGNSAYGAISQHNIKHLMEEVKTLRLLK